MQMSESTGWYDERGHMPSVEKRVTCLVLNCVFCGKLLCHGMRLRHALAPSTLQLSYQTRWFCSSLCHDWVRWRESACRLLSRQIYRWYGVRYSHDTSRRLEITCPEWSESCQGYDPAGHHNFNFRADHHHVNQPAISAWIKPVYAFAVVYRQRLANMGRQSTFLDAFGKDGD